MSSVILQTIDRIAHLTINRAEVRNSLNTEVLDNLVLALDRISHDQSVRCVLISGAGHEAFCAGVDLRELTSLKTLAERELFFGKIASVFQKMFAMTHPIVAKVHGYALAGGCGIAASADIVLASHQAIFGLPEVKIGLVPLTVLPPVERAIGHRATAELALTGETINAERALAIGLATRLFPKKDLDAEALKLCHRLTENGPGALGETRHILQTLSREHISDKVLALSKKSASHNLSPEASEGIEAFFEKRTPSWK